MAAKRKASRKAGTKAAAEVAAVVNGQATGHIVPGDSTIFQAAEKLAAAHGLRAFSIRVNGSPVKAEAAQKPLAGAKSLEVFAKDTRG